MTPDQPEWQTLPYTGPVTWRVAGATPLLSNTLAAGDANPAFQIGGDGKQQWGAGGASALDTNLYRSSAGNLATDSLLLVRPATVSEVAIGYDGWAGANGPAISFSNGLDAVIRRVAASVVGLGGTAASQVRAGLVGAGGTSGISFQNAEAGSNLYRSGPGQLRVDGSLIGAGALITKTKAGAPVDADVTGGALDGALLVDSTNNKLWARIGGIWKGVVIA